MITHTQKRSVQHGKAHRLQPFAKKVETRLAAEQAQFCETVLTAMGMDEEVRLD